VCAERIASHTPFNFVMFTKRAAGLSDQPLCCGAQMLTLSRTGSAFQIHSIAVLWEANKQSRLIVTQILTVATRVASPLNENAAKALQLTLIFR